MLHDYVNHSTLNDGKNDIVLLKCMCHMQECHIYQSMTFKLHIDLTEIIASFTAEYNDCLIDRNVPVQRF